MSLVRLFDEFKKICFDNQNELWKTEQQFVKDRGADVVKLLLRAKDMSIPGQIEKTKNVVEAIVVEPDQDESYFIQDVEQPKVDEVVSGQLEGGNEGEITFEDEMVEEHLDETYDNPPPVRFMCTNINCDRLFETKDEMEVHTKSHKIIRPRSQPYTSTRRNETLEQDSYICQVCQKVFENIAGLVEHRKLNHFPKKCSLCGLAMPNESLTAHQAQCRRDKINKMKVLEPVGKRIKSEFVALPPDTALYKCGYCNSEFKTIENYRQHYKKCSNPDKESVLD